MHLQDFYAPFVGHISPNMHWIASALIAKKLALLTSLFEATFLGFIALDVLLDS